MYRLCHLITEFKDGVRRFFKPNLPRTHKAFPRYKWHEVDDAIEKIGFAIILDFWFEQVVNGCVSWDTSSELKNCYKWMESAVFYIQTTRPQLQKQLDNAITEAVKDFSLTKPLKKNTKSEKALKLSNKLEAKIDKLDTHHLYSLVRYRGYMWT
jgi:hypothetical protein